MVDIIVQFKANHIPVDEAHGRLAALEKLLMPAFSAAHGRDLIKPKMHWALHFSGLIKRLRCIVDQFVIERLHHDNKAAAQTIQNVTTLETTMMEAGVTKKFADLRAIGSASMVGPSLVGAVSAFPNVPGASVAKALRHGGTEFCVGDLVMPISAVVREIGDVTACISENGIFYVFVEVLLRKREVTRHSCVFAPSGAMALWRVGSLALVPAWQHGTDSTLVLW